MNNDTNEKILRLGALPIALLGLQPVAAVGRARLERRGEEDKDVAHAEASDDRISERGAIRHVGRILARQ